MFQAFVFDSLSGQLHARAALARGKSPLYALSGHGCTAYQDAAENGNV